jgi:hypothetical protein
LVFAQHTTLLKHIKKIRVKWEYFKICWGKGINVGVEKKISIKRKIVVTKYEFGRM